MWRDRIFPFLLNKLTSSGQKYTINLVDATQKCENRRASENALFFCNYSKFKSEQELFELFAT